MNRRNAGGSTLILSVDDELSILFTRHKLLQGAGYDVLSAPGHCGIKEHKVHRMGSKKCQSLLAIGIDVGVVAQEIKRSKPNVPVILVSASPVPESVLACTDCLITKGEGPGPLLSPNSPSRAVAS